MKNRVLFLGSKKLGFRCFELMMQLAPESICAAVTVDDKGDARSVLSDFERFADKRRVPLCVADPKVDLSTYIQQFAPRLCLAAGWYQLIKPEVLSSVPGGFVGLHASLLPAYRGGAPLVWAMINGEREAGISLFHFSAGMDDGDIIGQRRFSIEETEDISDVLQKAEREACSLIDAHYISLLQGKAPRTPQEHSRATYCAQRRAEDGRIDWSWDARRVYNFIRAQTYPYPGAYCLYKGDKLVIWKAGLLPHQVFGTPGQVMRLEERAIICCGRGAIEPLLINPENGPVENFNDYIKPGSRLER